jgi:hypothetical protein
MNSPLPLDWWPTKSQSAVLTALGALDEAITDAMHIARCVAEERRQHALEAGYRHAAQHKRVHETLQVFRESYRRDASRFTPVGREAPEAHDAKDAVSAFEDAYRRTS